MKTTVVSVRGNRRVSIVCPSTISAVARKIWPGDRLTAVANVATTMRRPAAVERNVSEAAVSAQPNAVTRRLRERAPIVFEGAATPPPELAITLAGVERAKVRLQREATKAAVPHRLTQMDATPKTAGVGSAILAAKAFAATAAGAMPERTASGGELPNPTTTAAVLE